jgi:hypothetical protein
MRTICHFPHFLHFQQIFAPFHTISNLSASVQFSTISVWKPAKKIGNVGNVCDMRDLGIFGIVTWEVLVRRVSKQLRGVWRDLVSIGFDRGSFGAMICMIWEALVLQVGKYYDASCHVTLGSFSIVIRDTCTYISHITCTYHIMIFSHTFVCFATWSKFVYCLIVSSCRCILRGIALRLCSRRSGYERGCLFYLPIIGLWFELE